MENETLERADRDLSDVVVDGVSLDDTYMTSDDVYNALEQNKGDNASNWGRCVWSQCDYRRK